MGLTVSDLSCDRGGRAVLRDVGCVLPDGEILAVRGPNGAGKSTLLRVLAGLLPARGRIELDGRALADDPEAHAERVAYAGHLDAVKPQLSVAENLGFWAGLAGGDPEAALAGFGLAALAERPAYLCSAGQKRRLGLARLLLAPRRLWLLDEPTVALDAAAVAALGRALATHCAAGGAAVVATHVDLGLPCRTLELRPPAAAPAGAFLAGRWT